MSPQTASVILMVRPANFAFNPETAGNNFYQQADSRSTDEIKQLALAEFDGFVDQLRDNGVEVMVVEDTSDPVKTDAVFPNNWFSTHDDGKVVLYPMYSPNRRLERRKDMIELLINQGFRVNEIIDLSFFEHDDQFLEGTGSLVLDRQNKIAYACKSLRTHQVPLAYFCRIMGYQSLLFEATQQVDGISVPIYHTNVMMHVGSEIAIVCLESIPFASERLKLQKQLEHTQKKMIPITAKQKFNFAGNMLEVQNSKGEKFTVMSKTAFDSIGEVQIKTIQRYTKLIVPEIPTIEKLGGGSVRCMMAELFLPSM
jgi:hypothetical protein